MAGVVKAPRDTDIVPLAAARGGGWLARLRTTPGRLRAGVALVVLLTCGLGLLTGMVFAALDSGFTAIGGHDAPLVEQSNALYYASSDMDAQVGNVLLTGSDPALAADQKQDLALYASDQEHAEQDLQQVAVTAATDPAAQRAVGLVLDALGRYQALAADAIVVNQRGHDPAGRPSAATLSYFQQATDLMSTTVQPAAASLTTANARALDMSYSQDRSTATSGQVLVLVLGLAVAGVLIGTQVFLAARFRRLINPALVAATVLAVGLAIAGAVQLHAQAGNLKVAKQDAFDSILALTQARAVSYDANADETRFLVDPGRAAAYQDAFLRRSQELVNVGNVGIFSYDAALAADIGAYQADNADVRFGGYLGTEFRNITFTGERAVATRALLAYQVYEKDDRALRAMAKINLAQAIAFDIGTGPGQSDWAFNQWDGALGSVITINENAFTAAIRDGHSTGTPWIALIPAIGTALIAALTIAGTHRRLAEYRLRGEIVALVQVIDEPGLDRPPPEELAGLRAGGRLVDREDLPQPAEILGRN